MIEQEELESIFYTTYFEDFAESCENLPLDILGRLYNDRFERTVPNYEECLRDIEDLVYGVSERVASSHQPLIVHTTLERLEELSEMALERAHGKCLTIDDVQECLEGKLGVLEVDRRDLLVRESSHPTHGTDSGNGEKEVVTSKSPRVDVVLPATPPKLTGRPTKQQRRSKRKSTPCPMRDFDLSPTLDFGRLDDNDTSNSASGPTEHTDPRHHVGSLASSNHCGILGASKEKVRRRNATGQKKKSRVISHSRRLSLATTAEPKYCFCKQVSDGDMIACDNETCAIEWFHFTCLQLTSKPRGKWYCPMCRGARPNVMKTRDTQEPQCLEVQAL